MLVVLILINILKNLVLALTNILKILMVGVFLLYYFLILAIAEWKKFLKNKKNITFFVTFTLFNSYVTIVIVSKVTVTVL
jgi:hypothetical protein